MARHTPGPFETGKVIGHSDECDDTPDVFEVSLYGPKPEEKHVATIWADSRKEAEQLSALFKSAPQLLEALETFTDEYVALVNSGDCGFWDPEKEKKVIAARATLTAAKPEE